MGFTKVCLDTNIIIYYLNNKELVTTNINNFISLSGEVFISRFVDLEILRGFHFKENNLRYETYINFRENLSILELTDVGSNIYLELYREVIRMGINKKDVDHFDILIASSAIEQNLPLVTNNQKDFVLAQKRFPHFNTLNWYDQKISFG